MNPATETIHACMSILDRHQPAAVSAQSLQQRRELPTPEEVRRMNGRGIIFPAVSQPTKYNCCPRGPQAQHIVDARRALAAKKRSELADKVVRMLRIKETGTIGDVMEITGSTYFATQKTVKWMREQGVIEYVPGCYGAGKPSIFRLPSAQPNEQPKQGTKC